jgi:hypothetical protein
VRTTIDELRGRADRSRQRPFNALARAVEKIPTTL